MRRGNRFFYSAAGKNVCVNVQPRDLPDNVDVVVTFEGQTRLTTGSFPQQSAPAQSAPAAEPQQAWPAPAEQPVREKPEQILPRRAPRIHADPEGNKSISVAELLAREGRTPGAGLQMWHPHNLSPDRKRPPPRSLPACTG